MEFEQPQDEIIKQLTEIYPDESAQAYAAFLHWANLPPAERYAPGVMENIAEKFNLAILTVKNYRANHQWTERIKLIDAHFARVQFQQRVKANEEHNLRFAEETREIQNKALHLSRQALNVVEKLLTDAALGSEIKETDWVLAKQPDGSHKKMPRTTQIIMKSTVGDIAPLFRVAVDVPGKVVGLPVETVPLETQSMAGNLAGKTKAELEEIRKALNAEKYKLTKLEGVQ